MAGNDRGEANPAMLVFGSALLMAVGALMIALCGGCTLFIAGATLPGILTGARDASYGGPLLILSLFLGGLPALLGVVLFRAGLRHYRAAGAKRPPSAPPPG